MIEPDFDKIVVEIAIAQSRLDAIGEELVSVRGLIRRLERQRTKAEATEAARAELVVMSVLKAREAEGIRGSLAEAVEHALKTCSARDALAIRKAFAAVISSKSAQPSTSPSPASVPLGRGNLPGQFPVGLSPTQSSETK